MNYFGLCNASELQILSLLQKFTVMIQKSNVHIFEGLEMSMHISQLGQLFVDASFVTPLYEHSFVIWGEIMFLFFRAFLFGGEWDEPSSFLPLALLTIPARDFLKQSSLSPDATLIRLSGTEAPVLFGDCCEAAPHVVQSRCLPSISHMLLPSQIRTILFLPLIVSSAFRKPYFSVLFLPIYS